MRRILFLAVVGCAAPVTARAQVPGRDLLAYPLGTAAEAPVLATDAGDGLWNPAAVRLIGARWRVGAAAVETPSEIGLGVQSLWAAAALPGNVTVGVSAVRAGVRDIASTGDDPTPHGNLPYGTLMASLVAATPLSRFVTGGVALRFRSSDLGDSRRQATGVDGGVLAGGGWWRDLRLGASTLLWRPGGSPDEATYTGGLDLRALGADSAAELRLGYSRAVYDGESNEHYAFAAARFGPTVARGGVALMREYGSRSRRARFGLGLHVATYFVAIARESSELTAGGTYLFTITTTAP